MSKTPVEREADKHTQLFGKIYHWTFTKKGKMTLHRGLSGKCKRHHYKALGERK